MPESALYVMCGLPFSGKTTLARALAQQCGLIHLDLDGLARARGMFPEEGIDPAAWGQLFGETYRRLATLLASGESIVFDAVNYDRTGRDRLRSIARQAGRSACIVYMDLPINEIERRRRANRENHLRPHIRDEDFVKLAEAFSIPTVDETLLIYDGRLPVTVWIQHNISGCTTASSE